MTTLGKRLKQQAIAREESRLASAKADTEAKRRAFEIEEKQIIEFFEAVKVEINDKVERNLPLKQIKLPRNSAWNLGYNYSNKPDSFFNIHNHSGLIKQQFEWFTENDLKAEFVYCHDGVGLDDWWELKVQPK